MADPYTEIVSELKSVKMLLVLQLLKSGVTQSQIAAMLGISNATMSRMIAPGLSKSIRKTDE